jgi:hypothetical protein
MNSTPTADPLREHRHGIRNVAQALMSARFFYESGVIDADGLLGRVDSAVAALIALAKGMEAGNSPPASVAPERQAGPGPGASAAA